jgi:predicted small lipoprotein YifL
MKRSLAGLVALLSLSTLAACASAPPPQGAPDRGPQIMQMQFNSRRATPASAEMDGTQATAIYQRYIDDKDRDGMGGASAASVSELQQ